jgi:hypothetical protein
MILLQTEDCYEEIEWLRLWDIFWGSELSVLDLASAGSHWLLDVGVARCQGAEDVQSWRTSHLSLPGRFTGNSDL